MTCALRAGLNLFMLGILCLRGQVLSRGGAHILLTIYYISRLAFEHNQRWGG